LFSEGRLIHPVGDGGDQDLRFIFEAYTLDSSAEEGRNES
jgi:hypothetical protein